jgi:hypothetical protein
LRLEDEAMMERRQQAAWIQMIVNRIAERSLIVPPEARPAYIQDEVAKVREAFRQTYATDPRLTAYAMGFVDRMEGWIQARVRALETSGEKAERVP